MPGKLDDIVEMVSVMIKMEPAKWFFIKFWRFTPTNGQISNILVDVNGHSISEANIISWSQRLNQLF